MNYDIYIRTGKSTISGCRDVSNLTNFVASVGSEDFSFNEEITGSFCSLVAANSQTLREDELISTQLPFPQPIPHLPSN